MTAHKLIALLVGFLAPAVAQAAAAQSQPTTAQASPVELVGDVRHDRIVIVDGQQKHELVEPKTVVPGDKLIFTTRYRNVGSAPVTNFVVTNTLPSAVSVTAESAAGLTVSVDGGKSWGTLASLTLADGKGGRRAASPGDVTHVRWIIPAIQPGANGALTYQAIVR